jgi:phenylacetate-CoA ligase
MQAMREPAVERRLQALIRDAARHVPLYRRRWQAAGLDVERESFGGDFERLPLLDKTALLTCSDQERTHERRQRRRHTRELSSGSTGQPLQVAMDRRAWLARRLAFLGALLACGYRPGMRCLLLSSRDRSRWPALARWTYASIAEETDALSARIATLAPNVLYGPLSTLELLADASAAHGAGTAAPAIVISTAEQLTRRRREAIARGFGAPVADFYGMTEFGLVAYRPAGSASFVPARGSLLLEYLPVPEEPGIERLVITDLAERRMPLIRYDTGDTVRRDQAQAGSPIVEIAGRACDCLLQPGGRRVSPYRIDVELERIPGLRAFEVVQRADLSVDVTLDATPAEAGAVGATVRHRLQSVLGTGLQLRIATGAIERGAPGSKFRPIRSQAGAGA